MGKKAFCAFLTMRMQIEPTRPFNLQWTTEDRFITSMQCLQLKTMAEFRLICSPSRLTATNTCYHPAITLPTFTNTSLMDWPYGFVKSFHPMIVCCREKVKTLKMASNVVNELRVEEGREHGERPEEDHAPQPKELEIETPPPYDLERASAIGINPSKIQAPNTPAIHAPALESPSELLFRSATVSTTIGDTGWGGRGLECLPRSKMPSYTKTM